MKALLIITLCEPKKIVIVLGTLTETKLLDLHN